MPLAAVGGQTKIMTLLAPAGPVYQAGTLSGNPIATAAAIATLDILVKKDCYFKLETKSAILANGLRDAAKQVGIPIAINRVGSLLSCFFTNQPVRNFEDVKLTDISKFKKFFAEMLKRGIYMAPSAYEAMFISLAHSKEDIEKTVKSAQKCFHNLR